MIPIDGIRKGIFGLKANTLSVDGAQSRHEIVHSYRWNIFEQISVPLLRRFHARMAKKVPNFENVACCVVDETACVASKFITRLGSIFYPLADPSGVPAIDCIFRSVAVDARNNVVVGRQISEPHQFLEDVRRDRNPTFTTFRIKIFLRTFDYSDSPILNPTPPRVSDFNVA